MVNAGTKGETLVPQIPQRLVRIHLCPGQVVLHAGDEAAHSSYQSTLPARIFGLRGSQSLFHVINGAETGIDGASERQHARPEEAEQRMSRVPRRRQRVEPPYDNLELARVQHNIHIAFENAKQAVSLITAIRMRTR